MRYVLIALLVLVAASAGIPAEQGDQAIRAQYAEDASHADSTYRLGAYPFPLPTQEREAGSSTIIREAFLPIGVHAYTLTALDLQGLPSIFSTNIDVSRQLMISLERPLGGVAQEARFPVQISTSEDASCQWQFYRGGEDSWRAMAGSGGRLHGITNFSRDYRFNDGESVPLRALCTSTDGAASAQIVFPVGWSTANPTLSTVLWPNPIAPSPDHRPEIVARLSDDAQDYYTRCMVTNAQESASTTPLREHRFSALQGVDDSLYIVSCLGLDGQPLPQQELLPQQTSNPSVLNIWQDQPRAPLPRRNVTLSVLTSRTAECLADIAGEERTMGPMREARLHQLGMVLPEGTTQGTVTCNVSDQATASIPVSITVDTTAPRISWEALPARCDGEILLAIRRETPDATHVILEANDHRVVRELRASVTSMRQGGLGMSPSDSLTVTPVDAAGNQGQPLTVDSVAASQEPLCGVVDYTQDLVLLSPADGNAQDLAFPLQVISEFRSVCTWTINGATQRFNTTDDTFHQEDDLPSEAGLTIGQEYDLEVSCVDEAEQTATEAFRIAYNLTRPAITSLSANPSTVTSRADPYSTITAITDQETRCGYDDGGLSPWDTTHSFSVAIADGVQARDVMVNCTNRNGLWTNRSVTINEDFPTELTISVRTPAVSGDRQTLVRARTNMRADCEVEADGSTIALTATQGVTHQRSITFPEDGTYEILYRCYEDGRDDKMVETAQALRIDTAAPGFTISSPDYTCGTDEYTVRVEDASADITSWRITFADATFSANSMPERLDDLDLEEDEDYNLSVTAFDAAGNTATGNATITAKNETDGACDDQAPDVSWIPVKSDADGRTIRMVCRDDAGCEDDFLFGTAPLQGSCEADDKEKFSANKTWTFTETTQICWEASDINGNDVRDETIILVGGATDDCEDSFCEGAGTCSDGIKNQDETDVDCGGFSCPDNTCDTGQACKSLYDCTSGVCSSGVCTEPSCNDGAKNQDETDADCGGATCSDRCDLGEGCESDLDCESGICGDGDTCVDERRPGRENPSPGDPEPPTDEGGSVFALLLIILGVLCAGGGSGYIWYERQHEDGGSVAVPRGDPLQGFKTKQESSTSAPAMPQEDYATSKLREEARSRKRSGRAEDRKALLDSFAEEPEAEGETESPEEKPTSTAKTRKRAEAEDPFAELEEIAEHAEKKTGKRR